MSPGNDFPQGSTQKGHLTQPIYERRILQSGLLFERYRQMSSAVENKKVTVFAVREEDQRVSGIILCGLSQVHIQDILNVFRVKSARQTLRGLSREVNSLVAPARTEWSGSSFLLLVGNPHAKNRERSQVQKLCVKPGDDLVTGPSGFCVSVDLKDEECLRGLKALGQSLANQPLSERLELRRTDFIKKPCRRFHPLSERLRARYESFCSTGERQLHARNYLALVASERREYRRRLRAYWVRKVDYAVSRAIMNRVETRSSISVIVTEVNGAPALQFMIEQVPRFVPRPVKQGVRRLQRLGHALRPATA